MRDLKRLSFADDDPSMTTASGETPSSDVENGKFPLNILIFIEFFLL